MTIQVALGHINRFQGADLLHTEHFFVMAQALGFSEASRKVLLKGRALLLGSVTGLRRGLRGVTSRRSENVIVIPRVRLTRPSSTGEVRSKGASSAPAKANVAQG